MPPRRPRKRRNLRPLATRGVPEVVLLLQVEPQSRLGAERVGEPEGHRRSDSRVAVQEARKSGPRHLQPSGRIANWHRPYVFTKNLARMGRVVHRVHSGPPSLMIIAFVTSKVEAQTHNGGPADPPFR